MSRGADSLWERALEVGQKLRREGYFTVHVRPSDLKSSCGDDLADVLKVRIEVIGVKKAWCLTKRWPFFKRADWYKLVMVE